MSHERFGRVGRQRIVDDGRRGIERPKTVDSEVVDATTDVMDRAAGSVSRPRTAAAVDDEYRRPDQPPRMTASGIE